MSLAANGFFFVLKDMLMDQLKGTRHDSSTTWGGF
jgi:hypothetical protein